jgi:hypothetical protein
MLSMPMRTSNGMPGANSITIACGLKSQGDEELPANPKFHFLASRVPTKIFIQKSYFHKKTLSG